MRLFFWTLPILIILALATACTPNMSNDEDDDDGDPAEDDDDAVDDDDGVDDDDTSDDEDDDDDQAPAVVASSPEEGEDELKLATVVSVTFSKAMDTASVESAFTLTDEAKTDVTGAFSWDNVNEKMTFTPVEDLTEDTDYIATIGIGAADTYGNPLEEEFQLSFATVNLWTRTVNGADDGDDTASGISVSVEGNIFVAGKIYVEGEDTNVWIQKYDPDGNDVWDPPVTHNGSFDHEDLASDVAVDEDENVYATGWETVNGQMTNFWVGKYNSYGVKQWTFANDGGWNIDDEGYGIACDNAGNAYVTGFIGKTGEGSNIWTAKYNGPGTPAWDATYNGAADDGDIGFGVALDGQGKVYVAGRSSVTGEGSNIWIGQYDGGDEAEWTVTVDGTASDSDQAKAVAVDEAGDIYVAGWVTDSVTGVDAWLGKYNSAGTEIWTLTYNGIDSEDDAAYGVVLSPEGNIFVVGGETVAGEDRNILVQCYSESRTLLWADLADGGDGVFDEARDVAVDANGNLYVTGFVTTATEGKNIWLRKYDPDGNWSDD